MPYRALPWQKMNIGEPVNFGEKIRSTKIQKRRALRRGNIPTNSFVSLVLKRMAALDKVGYRGWGISEQPNNQAADVESARDLAERMDRIFAL